MRHTISLFVDNESGVLSRVAGLFSARGFNIESLNVAETLDPDTSRITLVTTGDDFIIEQVIKRFNNMVNVIWVDDLTEDYTDLHGWTEVYLPGAGWIGLDATSGAVTGEGHIPLASSPEPAYSAPISGLAESTNGSLRFSNSIRRV